MHKSAILNFRYCCQNNRQQPGYTEFPKPLDVAEVEKVICVMWLSGGVYPL